MIDYKKIIRNRELRLQIINLLSFIPSEPYLKMVYRIKLGKKLNLDNPVTYNEKLNWLKLHEIHPEYTKLVDKLAVRDYIKEKIGEEYLFPLLGAWERFEDIDFDTLPDKFVLKCNHDSGSVKIIKDKSKMDKKALKKFFNRRLKLNAYVMGREYPYKDVPPRIIAEKYMTDDGTAEQSDAGLTDYKFFCFNGVADCVMVCRDRHLNDTKFYFFDRDWKLCRYNRLCRSLPEDFTMEKPELMDKMFEIADTLSKGMATVRLDLYECNGQIYFGEFTFFPSGGFEDGFDVNSDTYFGSLVTLP